MLITLTLVRSDSFGQGFTWTSRSYPSFCFNEPLLLTGVSAGSLVYVLAPGGVLDHETDVSARLNGALPPNAPPLLREFTLCLWFQVITFHTANPIISYSHASNPYTTFMGKLKKKKYKVNISDGLKSLVCWYGDSFLGRTLSNIQSQEKTTWNLLAGLFWEKVARSDPRTPQRMTETSSKENQSDPPFGPWGSGVSDRWIFSGEETNPNHSETTGKEIQKSRKEN